MPVRLVIVFFLIFTVPATAQWNYPKTKTVDSSDTYFGVTYPDPYRWLENLKDPSVTQWFSRQAAYTAKVLDRLPARKALVNEWMQYDRLTPPNYTAVSFRNGRLFYCKQNAADAVAKAYYRDGMKGKEILLFDPANFEKGKTYSITNMIPSGDGKKIGITYTEMGREISTVRIMDVDKKTFLPGKAYPSWEGILSWMPDNRSFTYLLLKTDDVTSPDIALGNQSRLHRLGDDYDKDTDVFSIESYPDNILAGEIPLAKSFETSPDYIFCEVAGAYGSNLKYYFAPTGDLQKNKIGWKQLCRPEDELTKNLIITGDTVFAVTMHGAPNNKVVMSRLNNLNWQNAETVIGETSKLLEAVVHCKDYLLLVYSNNGVNQELYQYHIPSKKMTPVQLPYPGNIGLLWLDKNTSQSVVGITSWNKPYGEFIYDAATGFFEKSPLSIAPRYPAAFNDVVVEEVEVPGHDGVMVPMSILYKRGLQKNGNHACIMESYGAYGISTSAEFSFFVNSLVLKDVVFAFPHVRGGGEKGESWHLAGFKTTKPNTWKDFNACAEYLVSKGFTSKNMLAGKGKSAGGILITRAITERPDLYAAAICEVGITNVMRNEFTPNGPTNIGELGTVADSTECRALYEMDAVQHVRPQTHYPAVLCTAGWNDPRVIAWQPAKFAAALQKASLPGRPVLLEVDFGGGHNAADKFTRFTGLASQYAFALWQCGHPLFRARQK